MPTNINLNPIKTKSHNNQ